MTLSDTTVGKSYIVENIDLDEDVKRRFRTLGLTDRTPIRVLGKNRGGAVIIAFRGSRFAVGRKFCEGIFLGGEAK